MRTPWTGFGFALLVMACARYEPSPVDPRHPHGRVSRPAPQRLGCRGTGDSLRRHARERPLDRPSARGGSAHESGGAGSGAPRLAGLEGRAQDRGSAARPWGAGRSRARVLRRRCGIPVGRVAHRALHYRARRQAGGAGPGRQGSRDHQRKRLDPLRHRDPRASTLARRWRWCMPKNSPARPSGSTRPCRPSPSSSAAASRKRRSRAPSSRGRRPSLPSGGWTSPRRRGTWFPRAPPWPAWSRFPRPRFATSESRRLRCTGAPGLTPSAWIRCSGWRRFGG